tara:strand:+ start:3697 stop:4593 length:897 start_codon:yes stop_codon:yes gene_type:complete
MLPNLSGLDAPAGGIGGTRLQPHAGRRRGAATSVTAVTPSLYGPRGPFACPPPETPEYVTITSKSVEEYLPDGVNNVLTLSVDLQFEGAPTLRGRIRSMLPSGVADTTLAYVVLANGRLAQPSPDRAVEALPPRSADILLKRFKNIVIDMGRSLNVIMYLLDQRANYKTGLQVITRTGVDEKDSITFTMKIPSVNEREMKFLTNDFYKLFWDRMVWKNHEDYAPHDHRNGLLLGAVPQDGNLAVLEMLCSRVGVRMDTLKTSPGHDFFEEEKLYDPDDDNYQAGTEEIAYVYVDGICV